MRLTHYDELKERWQINNDYGAVIIDELNYAVGEATDKLAAYENAGLAPEEFKESVEFVLELNKKLKPYMEAEEQERLVVLPCKIGDVIWWKNAYRIVDCHVVEVQISAGRSEVIFRFGPQLNLKAGAIFEDFGKTIFLTREEAEAALKKE